MHVHPAMEIVLVTLYTFFFIIPLAMYAAGSREDEYSTFALLILAYLIVFLLEGSLLFEPGRKPGWVQRIIPFLTMLVPVSSLWFVFSVIKEPWNRLAKMVTVAALVFAAFLLLNLFLEQPFRQGPVYFLFSGGCMVMGLLAAMRAHRQKRSESKPVLIGFAGFFVGWTADAAGSPGYLNLSFMKIRDLGFVFFLCFIAYGLVARFVRLHNETRMFSRKILEAHQKERIRLSRDIHDGIGQSLLAVKLRMQMAGSKAEGHPELKEIISFCVGEISEIGRELSHIVMDLRPAFLEELTTDELFRWIAARFSEKTRILVSIEGHAGWDCSMDVKENLYRFCQEALANAAKHSEATEVVMHLHAREGRLLVEIKDNGRGFDPLSSSGSGQGTGLLSMKERAELLGGRFEIRSAPGRGCAVSVEVNVS